jgi:ankyrin repeat protein
MPLFDVDHDDIVHAIFAAFPAWNLKIKDILLLNASIYTTGSHPQLNEAMEDFRLLKSSHALTPERAGRIDNENGITLAHIAAQNGDAYLIPQLAAYDVNLNTRASSQDFTPAMYAVQNGDSDTLNKLAENGAYFNIKSLGNNFFYHFM